MVKQCSLQYVLYVEPRPEIVTLYTADVGVAYCIFCILQKKSHSHSRFCHGHWVASNISGVVTSSPAVHTITDSFWADTYCDLGGNSMYSVYWSVNPVMVDQWPGLSISVPFEHFVFLEHPFSVAARTSCGWIVTKTTQPRIHWSPEAMQALCMSLIME